MMMRSSIFLFAITITLMAQHVSAQIVSIPDPIFKAYLVGEPLINTNMDAEIQVSEATIYTGDIDIPDAGIIDFTGLQAFVAVGEVYIDENLHSSLDVTGMTALWKLVTDHSDSLQSITFGSNPNLSWVDLMYCIVPSIDVSSLTALQYLHITDNPITNIDLSNNPNLNVLSATLCDLTSLDVTNNLWLIELYLVWNTNLQSLDLSNQHYLEFLNVMNCDLNYLNVANGNNHNMNTSDFRCWGNNDLFSVCVDDTAYSNMWWQGMYVDTFTVFSDTCAATPGTSVNNYQHSSVRIMNNPTQDFVYLDQPYSFTLLNISGSVVTQTINSSVVDMRHLSPGVYIMMVTDDKGLPAGSFKLVKQ